MSEPAVVITDGDFFSITEDDGAVLHQGAVGLRHHPTPPPSLTPPPAAPRQPLPEVPRWRVARRVR